MTPPEADLTRALYEQYANQIFRYCLHQLGSREEAEDAVQSTFLNAFRGIKRGVVPELESAWLFKIAHNVCLSRRRSSWRRGRVESPADFEVVEELAPAPSRRADELIGLQDVLEQMPETQRRAILLREWQGLSYREIAEELELSQAAVETLIFRARRSLASGLEQPPVRAKRRVARAADWGNVITAIKSLLIGGSAAAKVAATVAVVSGATVVAAEPVVQHQARHQHAQTHSVAPTAKAKAPAAATGHATVVHPAAPAGHTTSHRARHAVRHAASAAPARRAVVAHAQPVQVAPPAAAQAPAPIDPTPQAAQPTPVAPAPAQPTQGEQAQGQQTSGHNETRSSGSSDTKGENNRGDSTKGNASSKRGFTLPIEQPQISQQTEPEAGQDVVRSFRKQQGGGDSGDENHVSPVQPSAAVTSAAVQPTVAPVTDGGSAHKSWQVQQPRRDDQHASDN